MAEKKGEKFGWNEGATFKVIKPGKPPEKKEPPKK
jgi:hypothetical protein